MHLDTDRRTLLKLSVYGLVGLALRGMPTLAAGDKGPAAVTTPLNDRIAVISGVGGNVVALTTADSQLLVDAGAREHTGALRAQLRKLGAAPVRTLFNTHWHADHSGGNEYFGKGGAQIIAHEKTRLWLATDHYQPRLDRYEKALPKIAQPTRTFYTRDEMTVGEEHIDFGYLLEAHTDGDIYVHFRDSNVLAVGGAMSPDRDPEIDWYAGGWLGGRVDSLALLLKLSDERTRIVPATGPVLSRSQLQAEHDMLAGVFKRMDEMLRKGMSAREMQAAGVLEPTGRSWQDPQKFLDDSFRSLWAHHNTLSHEIV